VIGAGVVGLAVAARLAEAGVEVLLLERERGFGMVTSSRNSEVIHAGIYYKPGSLKATHCVAGKQALYRYCADRNIAYSRCGKLIVATTTEQLKCLEAIAGNARLNGVRDLSILDACDVNALEPELECVGALLSPSTGIIDSHGFMLSLLGDAENHGATLVNRAEVLKIDCSSNQRSAFTITVDQDDVQLQLQTRFVINAAGLDATAIADTISQLPASCKPTPVYFKGNYFRLVHKAPFKRLVYPVPETGGLGVHVTIDLSGMARFGPDVEPADDLNYEVDPERSRLFYAAIRRYWPALPDESLEPDYAGIRPRILYQGNLFDDFMIQDHSVHHLPGLINLFSIESPGLTASLAIADTVAQRLLH
jgi:L-2-hydroxyglutarate oxidase LhgO